MQTNLVILESISQSSQSPAIAFPSVPPCITQKRNQILTFFSLPPAMSTYVLKIEASFINYSNSGRV